jgi:hypothetical protein
MRAPEVALGRFSQWVGSYAPADRGRAGLWHLLTDAFPAPGITGIASFATLCMRGAFPVHYTDSGVAAGPDEYPRTPSGNRALMSYDESGGAGSACADESAACMAATGLTSRSQDVRHAPH